MHKFFVRIVALLLVPCLVGDPVTASAFSNSLYLTRARDSTLFQIQALAPRETSRFIPDVLNRPAYPLLYQQVRPLLPVGMVRHGPVGQRYDATLTLQKEAMKNPEQNKERIQEYEGILKKLVVEEASKEDALYFKELIKATIDLVANFLSPSIVLKHREAVFKLGDTVLEDHGEVLDSNGMGWHEATEGEHDQLIALLQHIDDFVAEYIESNYPAALLVLNGLDQLAEAASQLVEGMFTIHNLENYKKTGGLPVATARRRPVSVHSSQKSTAAPPATNSPASQLTVEDKIALVIKEYEAHENWMKRLPGYATATHSRSGAESILKFIQYLRQKGLLDQGKRFCDPFGGGLTAMLVHAATGAETTGYEINKAFHDEQVAIYHRLVQLGAIEPDRVQLVLGNASDADLKPYDAFYIYPPLEDGSFVSTTHILVIKKMKDGASFLTPFDLRTYKDFIPQGLLDVEREIKEIDSYGNFHLYRRVVNSPAQKKDPPTAPQGGGAIAPAAAPPVPFVPTLLSAHEMSLEALRGLMALSSAKVITSIPIYRETPDGQTINSEGWPTALEYVKTHPQAVITFRFREDPVVGPGSSQDLSIDMSVFLHFLHGVHAVYIQEVDAEKLNRPEEEGLRIICRGVANFVASLNSFGQGNLQAAVSALQNATISKPHPLAPIAIKAKELPEGVMNIRVSADDVKDRGVLLRKIAQDGKAVTIKPGRFQAHIEGWNFGSNLWCDVGEYPWRTYSLQFNFYHLGVRGPYLGQFKVALIRAVSGEEISTPIHHDPDKQVETARFEDLPYGAEYKIRIDGPEVQDTATPLQPNNGSRDLWGVKPAAAPGRSDDAPGMAMGIVQGLRMYMEFPETRDVALHKNAYNEAVKDLLKWLQRPDDPRYHEFIDAFRMNTKNRDYRASLVEFLNGGTTPLEKQAAELLRQLDEPSAAASSEVKRSTDPDLAAFDARQTKAEPADASQAVLLSAFKKVFAQAGSLERIRRMRLAEFAHRLGVRPIAKVHSTENALPRMFFVTPEIFSAIEEIRRDPLHPWPSDNIRSTPDLHAGADAPEIVGPGIYYDRGLSTLLKAEETRWKAGIVHELLEQTTLEFGFTDQIFSQCLNDLRFVVLEGELRFASLLGKTAMEGAWRRLDTKIVVLDQPYHMRPEVFRIFKKIKKQVAAIKLKLEILRQESHAEAFRESSKLLWKKASQQASAPKRQSDSSRRAA